MSRLLKAVNNKSSPKKSRGLSVACAPTEWAKKNQTARVSRQRGVGFSKKTIFKTVSPYRISHFIHEGYFPPVPPQMRWALARPHVPMGNLRCSPGVAGDDGTRATTERGNHARGTDRQKKSFIVRSCFATPKRASERPLDGHSRGSHREPATTGVIITHHRESPRESHAPRGSDGVTKGLSLCSRGRSRDTMHAKVEYKRIESNRSSLGRARGGLTTTTARMFPSWTDGRTDGTAHDTRRARTLRSVSSSRL